MASMGYARFIFEITDSVILWTEISKWLKTYAQKLEVIDFKVLLIYK